MTDDGSQGFRQVQSDLGAAMTAPNGDGGGVVETRRHHWTTHADWPCWCGADHTFCGARRANRDDTRPSS